MRNMSKHGFNSSCLNSPKNVKARGFTILELVIAIAIAALLVALSIPNFTESIKNNRLASKANDLVLGFKVTRQTAISRSVPTFVCHSNNANTNTPTCGGGAGSDWNTGFVIYAAPIKTLTTAKRAYAPATDTLIQQIDLADDQDILVTDTNADSVVSFGSDGFLFDSPAVEMQICDDRNGENGYLIRVSLSGKTSRERAIAPNECT
ncbi:MAG: type IV fimbrial biogenesis protein FimT [Arenicella sp.]|jgi:type IV fimbrial biogenesis protein FimT